MSKEKFLTKKKYRSEGKKYFAPLYLSIIIDLLLNVDKSVDKVLKM